MSLITDRLTGDPMEPLNRHTVWTDAWKPHGGKNFLGVLYSYNQIKSHCSIIILVCWGLWCRGWLSTFYWIRIKRYTKSNCRTSISFMVYQRVRFIRLVIGHPYIRSGRNKTKTSVTYIFPRYFPLLTNQCSLWLYFSSLILEIPHFLVFRINSSYICWACKNVIFYLQQLQDVYTSIWHTANVTWLLILCQG